MSPGTFLSIAIPSAILGFLAGASWRGIKMAEPLMQREIERYAQDRELRDREMQQERIKAVRATLAAALRVLQTGKGAVALENITVYHPDDLGDDDD